MKFLIGDSEKVNLDYFLAKYKELYDRAVELQRALDETVVCIDAMWSNIIRKNIVELGLSAAIPIKPLLGKNGTIVFEINEDGSFEYNFDEEEKEE